MPLNRSQMQQLQQALLSAFPNHGVLRQMVRFGLDENLDTIATGNLSNTVFELISWAESQDKLAELVVAATDANPGNRQVQAVAVLMPEWLASTSTPIPTKNGETLSMTDLPTQAQQESMRRHLQKGFTKSVPFVGALLEETLFGPAADEKASTEAAKLAKALARIQQTLDAQQTDIGDVLVRLDAQADLAAGTKASISALNAFLQQPQIALPEPLAEALDRLLSRYASGSESSSDAALQQAEASVNRIAPADTTPFDRFTFIEALERLPSTPFSQIVLLIEGAGNQVSENGPVTARVVELVRFAESPIGPGLEEVYRITKHKFPNFRVHP